jgi:hypothetical protein
VIKKSFSLDSKTFNKLQNGSDLLDLEIIDSSSTPYKKYNLLVNNDLLLRVEKKNKSKVKKILQDSLVNSKDLVSPKFSSKLKEIRALNANILEKIGSNVQRAYSTQESHDDFYLLLKQRWDKIEKLEKDLKIKILKRDSIGYCKKCHAFRQSGNLISQGDSPKSKCFICQETIAVNKTYYSLPEATAQYISGFWLEDYISKKLESLGWIIMNNIYIYGASSVKFEIDILATKQGKTLIVECKSGSSGLNNISSFLAKFYDIKTDLALYVSLPKVGHEMKNMVKRRKNFTLIDDVKSDKDIIRRLKQI